MSVLFLALVIGSLLFVFLANVYIEKTTEDYLYDNAQSLPKVKTGLVLGTSRYLSNQQLNPYFSYRINAAEELYKSGKIKYFILSGDNSVSHYNETEDMQNELIKRGIPEERIFLDHAGFRTLDSVIRAKEIFDQKKLIIISQKFHNQRAVFLARQKGIEAYGYNAEDVNSTAGFKTNFREKFARAKVFIDLLIGVEPKFYGKPILIP